MKQTPSQTVGPFYSLGLTRSPMNRLAGEGTAGEKIRIEGRVLDGDGQPVPDALVEIWQANAYGRYHHPEDKQEKPLDPSFSGWGRCGTNERGEFWFETIKPGSVPGPGTTIQAPHINVAVFARGMLIHAHTRIYFSDEASNAGDPVLSCIRDKRRRQTLIAARENREGGAVYRFDIRLQGEGETVFFDA
ncbi:MAG TPA: protocatechuate 3,4-dioxygenase subunit alpha [candidate division Zixibacteria bacterium]|nr:protocatechuate 3,4-dioxygenase subunit alpha [candidate division Zixibacteria bacterium]